MQDILLFINHHLPLFAALAIILVVLILLEFIKLKRGAIRLTPARLIQLMNHHKAVVIDIRSLDGFKTGHITNAISIPLSDLKNKMKTFEKFKSQPIVIVCATGADSPKAAVLLMQHGIQTQLLNGGMRAWRDAEMPLVKG
jgi:rhodanese-related sulfurtransferase